MSDLYNRIATLCSKKGVKIGTMCNELGISRGNVTGLKMGRKKGFSASALQRMADYLDVTVDYLLNGDSKVTISDELLMQGLLDGDIDGFTPEMLEEVKRFAKFVKSKGTV